jgi:hypothetical protein
MSDVCEQTELTDHAEFSCTDPATRHCLFCGMDLCERCGARGYCYVGSEHSLTELSANVLVGGSV